MENNKNTGGPEHGQTNNSGGATMSDYHSQEGATVPRLTYSIAKTLLSRSPLHAWYEHPLLGGKTRKPTKAMDAGSICHDLLLGGGKIIVIIDADSFRTKAAQEERDAAYAEDKIPVLSKDFETYNLITAAAEKQIKEALPEFSEPHLTEHPIIWTAENGVECQSKFDWISPTTGLMMDLKFTTDSSPEKCARKILEMGYDLQASFYSEGYRRTFPEMAGREKWLNIFIETEEPFAVNVVEMDSTFRELGDMKRDRALSIWKDCLSSDSWPGYGYSRIEAPGWAMAKMMEAGDAL